MENVLSEIVERLAQCGENSHIEISKAEAIDILEALGELKLCRDELAETSEALDLAANALEKAHDAFVSAETETKGLREIKNILGWRYKNPVNRDRLFWEYAKLITGDYDLETKTSIEPMAKKAAIEYLRKKYEFASYDAAYKNIQRAIKQRKDKYGGGGYKGLLPGNWPEV